MKEQVDITEEDRDDLFFVLDTLHYSMSEVVMLALDQEGGNFWNQAEEANKKLRALLSKWKLEREGQSDVPKQNK